MLVVKKFGGTSVGTTERIKNVANRVAKDYKDGNDVIVVLSAMGDTTDNLISLAKEISDKPNKREMDMLFTTGEQISVALLSMALQEIGIPAVSLNAFQIKMHTTNNYMNARLTRIDRDRIETELDNKRVVVITGFQGVNKYGDYTTLGRGGSDTTAVALAAALHADMCEIYTDVDGVYTADPRIVKDAKKLKDITYDEMLDLATLGAKVLHNRSVEMAKKYNVPLVVRSSLNSEEGTTVREETKVEKMLVSGVTADKGTARVSIIGVEDKPGIAFKVFRLLSKENINVDMILQSVGRDNTKDISFTVAKESLQDAIKIIESNETSINYQKLESEEKVSKVSIVGAGMMTNPGVATTMFESLYNADINIKMICTSEIRISVLIDEKESDRAVSVIHDAFYSMEDK